MANKKKDLKRLEKKKRMDEMSKLVRKGKCLKCSRPMVRNHKECHHCRKKRRLEAKANSRGHPKNYYLNDRKRDL